VVVLERRRVDIAGAQWHNGVLPWQFEVAGLEPPVPPEREARGAGVTHVFTPDGTHGVTVRNAPTVRADMALLGNRLRALATGAGAEMVDRVSTLEVDVDPTGRIRALDVTRGPAEGVGPATTHRLEADLFVDASGRQGVLRRHAPALARWCPQVRGDELCSASDHHVRIDDPDGAKRFLERYGAAPGQSVTIVGPHGGWSTRAVTVSEDLDHAAVLVGCLADGRYSTGPRMLDATRSELAWLGESLSGGTGVIPLRRPFARITAPGLALVGDAACQVFPAHGSGIGLGLIAGRLLADATSDAADCGDEATVWNYQRDYQHNYGGLLAAFDAFRRMSTALGSAGVTRMVSAGLLSEDMTRAGLDQRWQAPDPADLPSTIAKLARVPGVAAKMVPMLARGQLLRGVGARHPDQPDVAALARWDATVVRLLGPQPH
jgi:flavin-dependent dehydrogenase